MLLRQSFRQCLGKGFVNGKDTESLDSIQNGGHHESLWGVVDPPALQVKSEPFIALVSPSHTHPFMSVNHGFPSKKHELFFILTPTAMPSSFSASQLPAYQVDSDSPRGGAGLVELVSQSPGGLTLAAICSEITS